MEPDPDQHVHPGLESLQWASSELKGTTPAGTYNLLSEQARRLISGQSQCAMFCGGKKCKYCTYSTWTRDQMAVDGLYSSWITDNILAMSRPSTKVIKEKKLLDTFEKLGIKAVLNLQMCGEHSTCGEALHESGFSYDPKVFMDRGIYYYNFGWNDYGAGSMESILDAAKVMQFALSDGKIAVHCHAGLGRTGLMVACYLVYTNREEAGNAVQYVRSKRPNSIQTSEQVQTVSKFEEYLKPHRMIYALKDEGYDEISLRQFLKRQSMILHGFEERKLRFLPKIVFVCCERLLELADRGNSLQKVRSMLSMCDVQSDLLKKTFSSMSISRTFSDDKLKENLGMSPSPSAMNATTLNETPQNSNGNDEDEVDDDESIVYGACLLKKPFQEATPVPSLTISSSHLTDKQDSNVDCSPVAPSFSNSHLVACSADDRSTGVLESLMETDFCELTIQRVADYKKALNDTDEAWSVIAQEQDPDILTLLLWDWLDQLSEPVLSAQHLKELLESQEQPLEALHKVEKGVKWLVQYIARVVIKFQPMSSGMKQGILERLLSHLSQQVVRQEVLSRAAPPSMDNWPKMKRSSIKQLMKFFSRLISNITNQKDKP